MTLSESDMSFVHSVPDHHGDGLLGHHVAGLQVCKALQDVLDIWTSECGGLPFTKVFLVGFILKIFSVCIG